MDFRIPNHIIKKKVSYNPFIVGDVVSALPTTFAQREIWASLKMDSDSTLCYNECLSINLFGNLKIDLFDSAFQQLIKIHDSLRTVFSSDGKHFFIKEYENAPITVIDLSDSLKKKEVLGELEKNEIVLKFDLELGPNYRCTLIKLGDQEYQCLFSAHHIICDGWSFSVLLTELSEYYNLLLKGDSLERELPHQFANYAIEELRVGFNENHKRYWHTEFSKPLIQNQFPIDYKRPSFRTFNSDRVDLEVPIEISKKFRKFAASNGCSLYSALISAFNIFLYQLTKSEDIVVGLSSATQPVIDQNNLVGHMVNLLPLRMKIDEKTSVITFMKELRKKMLDAFDHQSYAYGSLVKDLPNLIRDNATLPLLNTVFNIDQQAVDQGLNFSEIKSSFATRPRNFENFEIFINVVSRGESLIIETQYNTNLFKASTISNWISYFVELLNTISQHPGKSIQSLTTENLFIPKLIQTNEKTKVSARQRDTAIEMKIKNIWNKILLIEDINVEDNFFSIGGHSLLAIEMAQELQNEFQITFSLKDIFLTPTILEQSNYILSNKQLVLEELSPILETHQLKSNVTHNQLQVWYLEEMFPQTSMHNLPSAIRIKCHIDKVILEKSLSVLVARHPSFRTALFLEAGVPVQKILDSDLPEFKIRLDLIQTDETEIEGLLNIEAQYIFDKGSAPLFKAKLFELGKKDYVFFFMPHHSIFDGWSFDIFFEELNFVYSSLVESKLPVFIKNPVVNYIDYSIWLNSQLETQKLNKQITFWEEKLKWPLPILELPTDYKRPLVMNHEGGTLPFVLDQKLAEDLRSFARHSGTSLFNVLLTAFKITLSRFSGIDDIIVGTPIRGRSNPEVMQTIGYFVNALALRTFINLENSFEENLAMVNLTSVEAFDNQQVPFQIVLNKIKFKRDSSRTPIFQTFFSYQDVNNRDGVINGVPYSQININKASTHTDLDLWIKASDKKIEGAFEYRLDLFKNNSVQQFLDCFFELLNNLNQKSRIPLHAVKAIPDAHIENIKSQWSNLTNHGENWISFHKLFEKNALINPNGIALEMNEGAMTYEELNLLANRCASGLIEKGVTPGDLVGVSISRGFNLVAALLGVLKTGAGYVPLDPGFPEERLDYMVESSKPKVILVDQNDISRFKNFKDKANIQDFIGDSRLDNRVYNISSALGDTCYVIYTSGSTGLPKGVEITHHSVINFLLSMRNKNICSKNDKLLAVTTLSFDIAVLELYLPLVVGGTVFLATSAEAMDGGSLKNIIQNKKITLMQATPSTWRLLLASGWSGNKSLRVLCGGETFPSDLVKKLIPMTESVWNMYGPTETTVWSTCKKLSLNDEVISIGTPLDNTQLYILDKHLNHRPIGAIGELYIGGIGLAKGYFGRPDLTIDRFIQNIHFPEQKMYATGDLARFLSNGEVECLGRNDGQVKIRGYRIELGEIESQLLYLNNINEAAVITSEFKPGDVRIVAYIVGDQSSDKALRELLSKKLPAYMIPSHFVYLSELPKTLNGKIDRKNLPSVNSPEKVTESEIVVNYKSNISESIRQMWIKILGIDQVVDSDNFFNIGGNSLLAVELYSLIANKYKINLPLSLLIEADNFQNFVHIVQSRIETHSPQNNLDDVPTLTNTYHSLVAINHNKTNTPLFCFHGVGGNVLNYVSLIPAVKNKRPLLAFQSIGLDGVSTPLKSIEEMAQVYLKELRIAQPVGPYMLAGGSMGGLIAFEVANELIRSGEIVEKLIMFDTFGPNLDLKSYKTVYKTSIFKRIYSGIFRRCSNLAKKFQIKIFRKMEWQLPISILLFDIERKNYEAIWKYKPRTYTGDIYLIRSKIEKSGWYSDPAMGWDGIIEGQLKTFEISATHADFIEDPELVKILSTLV